MIKLIKFLNIQNRPLSHSKWLLQSFLILLPILTACDDSKEDIKDFVRKVQAEATTKEEKAVALEPDLQPTVEDFQITKDPFAIETTVKSQPEIIEDIHFNKFELKDLSYVGFIKNKNTLWGLVLAPNKEIAYVKINERIGKNLSKIISIEPEMLKLFEPIDLKTTNLNNEITTFSKSNDDVVKEIILPLKSTK